MNNIEEKETERAPLESSGNISSENIDPWMDYQAYITYKNWEAQALKDMKNVVIPTLEERIKKAYEDVEEMNSRDKTGLSAIEIMKPYQWLNNLLIIKNQIENE